MCFLESGIPFPWPPLWYQLLVVSQKPRRRLRVVCLQDTATYNIPYEQADSIHAISKTMSKMSNISQVTQMLEAQPDTRLKLGGSIVEFCTLLPLSQMHPVLTLSIILPTLSPMYYLQWAHMLPKWKANPKLFRDTLQSRYLRICGTPIVNKAFPAYPLNLGLAH
jgi:hypothetical protein